MGTIGGLELYSSISISVLVLLITLQRSEGWLEDIKAKSVYEKNIPDSLSFQGNESHRDYFKLLERDGESLLIGARNLVYNISLKTFKENTRLEWHSNKVIIDTCVIKGKSETDCQNYIRILIKQGENNLLLCGTNAYKPVCQHYSYKDGIYTFLKETDGMMICPYDPNHNSTALYVDGQLYVATVADFTARDSVVYREPLRTDQFDPIYLNEPNFVSSFAYQDYVYIFLREIAVEYINCGKMIYSRVARVCKNDLGGPRLFKNSWTSFLKARLNCSVPGDFPFYFNEIQSTSELIEGHYGGHKAKLVYAVFNTPLNSISGSAVCAFNFDDIVASFDGKFKEQKNGYSNWLAIPPSDVPEPRPGQCVNDSRTLPDQTLTFLKGHTLMDETVPAYWGQPIIIRASQKYRFTQIAVDPQVLATDNRTYDVLYIGTDNGRVIKVVNKGSSNNKVETVVIEELQLFSEDVPIINLKIYHQEENSRLVAVSQDEIRSIPLYRCKQRLSCRECISLQDPHCAWDTTSCVYLHPKNWNSHYYQSIQEGKHDSCPDGSGTSNKIYHETTASPCRPCLTVCPTLGETTVKPSDSGSTFPTSPQSTSDNAIPEDIPNSIPVFVPRTSPVEDGLVYRAETLALAVVVSLVLALAVGFLAGYQLAKCRRSEDIDTPYKDHSVELRRGANRLAREPSHLNHNESYLSPTNKPINLVLNVPPKSEKKANSSLDSKPVPKSKKIYL